MESYPNINNTPALPEASEIASDPTKLYMAELAREWGVSELQPLDSTEVALLHSSFNKARESGNRGDIDILVEDLADSFARQSPVFVKNARALRDGIRGKELESQTRSQQQAIFAQAKQAVLLQAQLPEELSKDEYQTAKDNIRARLITARSEQGDAFDPLTTLGLLKRDADGNEIFTWPEPGTFPATTDQKWQTYIRAVRSHVTAARELDNGTGSQIAKEEADRFRRHTHNDVSRDVNDLLGLGTDIEEARRLVAKMRDSKFPSSDTSEKARTNNAIGRNILDLEDSVSSAMRRDLYTRAYGENAMLHDPENGNRRSVL